jgi:hypothetical protein
MEKDRLNTKLRQYVKANLSPSQGDRDFVNAVYDAFRRLLDEHCIQIGSYPRFTAIRPLHDLDILYLLGQWDQESHDPSGILKSLHERIKKEYDSPTKYDLEASLQTHSVSIAFKDNAEQVFSVDIVPAYAYSKNEFGQDTYRIPEIARQRHGEKRSAFYETLAREHREMQWIGSDPRGYIEVAKRVNENNPDFRRTVKFVKRWKNACKEQRDDFELKSFHIEQVVTIFFQEQPHSDIFDGVFAFFVNLPETIYAPQIEDRTDSNKYIDSYLNDLTKEQREMILQARDHLLKTLEKLSDDEPIESLLEIGFYRRASASEQYLFDLNIPTLTDDNFSFEIRGEVQERAGGFRKFILDAIGLISVDRKIKFRVKDAPPGIDLFKWKVKNDNCSPEPRGEITDHRTKNDPELSKYIGDHYVECYAILDGVCVAKAKQNVKL